MPGGRINVRYTPDGKEDVAANAGDYIDPSDVHFDETGKRLYIKARESVPLSANLRRGSLNTIFDNVAKPGVCWSIQACCLQSAR
jgi:hypothetical protein